MILWIILEERNAVELKNAGIAELTRTARINLESGKAKIINRNTGADATAQFLSDDRLKSIPKRKSVEERAKEAGVLDLYNILYRILSLETHGHDLNSAEGSGEFDLSVMHMQGIGALLSAVKNAGSQWILYCQRLSSEDLRKLLGLK